MNPSKNTQEKYKIEGSVTEEYDGQCPFVSRAMAVYKFL
jgi:hypothetical protein